MTTARVPPTSTPSASTWPGSGREVLAEELVGPVDEVHAHRPSLSYVTQVTPRGTCHAVTGGSPGPLDRPRTTSGESRRRAYRIRGRSRRAGVQPAAGALRRRGQRPPVDRRAPAPARGPRPGARGERPRPRRGDPGARDRGAPRASCSRGPPRTTRTTARSTRSATIRAHRVVERARARRPPRRARSGRHALPPAARTSARSSGTASTPRRACSCSPGSTRCTS